MRGSKLAAFGLVAVAVPLPAGQAQASNGAASVGEISGLYLVSMDEIVVPIIDSDRMSGTLRFKLVLDASDAKMAERVTQYLPMLRAAAVSAGLEFARLNASGLRAVNAEQLDRDLTTAIKATEPGVSRVLLVEVRASQQY